MSQQLSLATRPKNLDQLVGQKKVVEAIRGHWASGRIIKCWLFCGPKGCGKTSLSRILALSYQCTHQDIFGVPCQACRKSKPSYSIYEIPASKITGKADIELELAGADLGVLGSGNYRIYILDEAHGLSPAAQNLILKYLEDTPDTTIFILCSTRPDKILETIRRRCQVYELRELDIEDVPILVTRLLKFAKSEFPVDRITDALLDKNVRSPGLIAQAVEKYLAGNSPEDSAQVEGFTTVDIKAITRSLVKGDWPGVSQALMANEGLKINSVRLATVAYLRRILLEHPEIGERNNALARSLELLCSVPHNEDTIEAAVVAAQLYRVCAIFSKYKH